MNDTQASLRDVVKGLFAEGKVNVVVGYERGSLPLRSRPCFVRSADDADRLVWDCFCANNLTVYLPRMFERPADPKMDYSPPKVGVVAKGCDARSVVGLLKEHQVPRENVVIIGVPCRGIVDAASVAAELNGDEVVQCDVLWPDATLRVTTRTGQKKDVNRERVIADACIECDHPTAEGSDVMIEGESRGASEQRYRKLEDFEARSDEERWKHFEEEISKCIRCYACRQACPNCYCKECFADQTKPRWISAGDDLSDVMLYHIGRIFHQAGRCVECDACVRACPMDIDLRLFTQKLCKDVRDLFDYVPGLSVDAPPPLCAFDEGDSESFITEP